MNLEELLPLSKSFIGQFHICSWPPYAAKALGIKGPGSYEAENGKAFHGLAASLMEGHIENDEAIEMAVNGEVKKWLADFYERGVVAEVEDISAEQLVEVYFRLNERGEQVPSTDPAVFHGYMDLVFVRDDGVIVTRDWKTGRFEDYDDCIERHGYTAGTLALYPDGKKFAFQRYFVRTGNCHEWTYLIDGGDVMVIGPDGEVETLRPDGDTPALMAPIMSEIARVAAAPVMPIPGEQCLNWYGGPCPHLGGECPAAHGAPAEMVGSGGLITTEDLEHVLATLKNGEFKAVTPDYASRLFALTQQAKGFVNKMEKFLEGWSAECGPIHVGGSEYGWKPTMERDIDKPVALAMLEGVPLEDMAKAVNVSYWSLRKLPRKPYGDLADRIIAATVTEREGKPKFGLLKR